MPGSIPDDPALTKAFTYLWTASPVVCEREAIRYLSIITINIIMLYYFIYCLVSLPPLYEWDGICL